MDQADETDWHFLRSAVDEGAKLTEAAVLTPHDPGGLSVAERAAFAERIARLGNNMELAERYADRLAAAAPSAEIGKIGKGHAPSSPRLAALVDHVDLMTVRPIDVRAEHIARLRAAGITDADIVRLSELIAFVNYRLRADLGIALLESVA